MGEIETFITSALPSIIGTGIGAVSGGLAVFYRRLFVC